MLVGGAEFSGSNYLFTMLRSSGVDEERKRHDKAVEQLQAAQAVWSRKRTERLGFINEELRRQGHAVQTFQDVDAAMQEYAQVPPHNVDPPGARTPARRLLSPRDRLRHPGDGSYRLCGLPIRQKVRRVLNYSLFSATLYHRSSRRALLRNARGRPLRPPPQNPRPSGPHHDRYCAKVA